MADPTDPLPDTDITPVDLADEASASRVGPRDEDEDDTLTGTDTMGSETGGLAGTSR